MRQHSIVKRVLIYICIALVTVQTEINLMFMILHVKEKPLSLIVGIAFKSVFSVILFHKHGQFPVMVTVYPGPDVEAHTSWTQCLISNNF